MTTRMKLTSRQVQALQAELGADLAKRIADVVIQFREEKSEALEILQQDSWNLYGSYVGGDKKWHDRTKAWDVPTILYRWLGGIPSLWMDLRSGQDFKPTEED